MLTNCRRERGGMKFILRTIWITGSLPAFVLAFGVPVKQGAESRVLNAEIDTGGLTSDPLVSSRRSVLSLASLGAATLLLGQPENVGAAVGSLPEFLDSNTILQGLTIKVADSSQQDAMIRFLEEGLGFQVLRKRIKGTVEETWLGFGPEQLSIPSNFRPVLSFAQYGGHASIHLVYDSKQPTPLYRVGDAAPGDSIAFLQIAVPFYRISKMFNNGGNILDAYGYVNVVSPSGLPIRGIIGIVPDPIMFIALNCASVEESKLFYTQMGFEVQDYPFARPSNGTGQFEPPQPPKSVYMAPSKNCMGLLLLLSKKKNISQNPVLQCLNIVKNPGKGAAEVGEDQGIVFDPSGVGLRFHSVSEFESEEQKTR
jgi:hypothetical protein